MREPENQEKLELCEALEARIAAGQATARDRINLALLYGISFRREDESIAVLKDLLREEPQNSLARIWLSYLYVFHSAVFQPETNPVPLAIEQLNNVIQTDEEYAAAAQCVLRSALFQLDHGSTGRKERIRILQETIATKPEWVLNHDVLACELEGAGEHRLALEHIEKARRNILADYTPFDEADREFEVLITGRMCTDLHRKELDRSEARIRQKLNNKSLWNILSRK